MSEKPISKRGIKIRAGTRPNYHADMAGINVNNYRVFIDLANTSALAGGTMLPDGGTTINLGIVMVPRSTVMSYIFQWPLFGVFWIYHFNKRSPANRPAR